MKRVVTLIITVMLAAMSVFADVTEESNARDTFYAFTTYTAYPSSTADAGTPESAIGFHSQINPDGNIPHISTNYEGVEAHPEAVNKPYIRVPLDSSQTYFKIAILPFAPLEPEVGDYFYLDYWVFVHDANAMTNQGVSAKFELYGEDTASESSLVTRFFWFRIPSVGADPVLRFKDLTSWNDLGSGNDPFVWTNDGTWRHYTVVYQRPTADGAYSLSAIRAGDSTNDIYTYTTTHNISNTGPVTNFNLEFHSETAGFVSDAQTNGVTDVYMGLSGIFDTTYSILSDSGHRTNWLTFRVAYPLSTASSITVTVSNVLGESQTYSSSVEHPTYYRVGVQLTNAGFTPTEERFHVSVDVDGHVLTRTNAFTYDEAKRGVVTNIAPAFGTNNARYTIAIYGTNLNDKERYYVTNGSAWYALTNVTYESAYTNEGEILLTGMPAGTYAFVISNTFFNEVYVSNALFTVYDAPAPTVTTLSPAVIDNRLTTTVDVFGENLPDGYGYYFTNNEGASFCPVGTNMVNQTNVRVTIDGLGLSFGVYDLVLVDAGGTNVLTNEGALTVTGYVFSCMETNITLFNNTNAIATLIGSNLQSNIAFTFVYVSNESTTFEGTLSSYIDTSNVVLSLPTGGAATGVYYVRAYDTEYTNYTFTFTNTRLTLLPTEGERYAITYPATPVAYATGGVVSVPLCTYENTNPVAVEIEVRIYTLAGKEVAVVTETVESLAQTTVVWDGATTYNGGALQGVYLARIALRSSTFNMRYERCVIIAK